MKVPALFKKGVETLVLASTLGACGAPEANRADSPEVETIAGKTNTIINFCLNSPSDVDGLICEIKREGEPVASLEVDCWKVREEGAMSVSPEMADELSGTDKLDIENDCEVQAGQW